jgi:hypothetical protein
MFDGWLYTGDIGQDEAARARGRPVEGQEPCTHVLRIRMPS